MDECTSLFDELDDSYSSLGSNAKSIESECSRLSKERDQLDEYANAIEHHLRFFDDLTSAERTVASSLPPDSHAKHIALCDAISKIEACASFVASNPSFSESGEYANKASSLRMKVLSSIKRSITVGFRNATSACSDTLQRTQSPMSEVQESETLHVAFRARVTDISPLCDSVAQHISTRSEYAQLARSISREYCDHRQQIVPHMLEMQMRHALHARGITSEQIASIVSLLRRFIVSEEATLRASVCSDALYNGMHAAISLKHGGSKTSPKNHPLQPLVSQMTSHAIAGTKSVLTSCSTSRDIAEAIELLKSHTEGEQPELVRDGINALVEHSIPVAASFLLREDVRSVDDAVTAISRAISCNLRDAVLVAVAQRAVMSCIQSLHSQYDQDAPPVALLHHLWLLRASLRRHASDIRCNKSQSQVDRMISQLGNANHYMAPPSSSSPQLHHHHQQQQQKSGSDGVVRSIMRFIRPKPSQSQQDHDHHGGVDGDVHYDDDEGNGVGNEGVDVLQTVQSEIRKARERCVESVTATSVGALLRLAPSGNDADLLRSAASEVNNAIERVLPHFRISMRDAMHSCDDREVERDVSVVLSSLEANVIEAVERVHQSDELPGVDGVKSKVAEALTMQ